MKTDNSTIVKVAVGVIARDEQYYLTKRLDHVHQGGKWEFPGGKVDTGETVAAALYRELKEEVAIEVLSCQPLEEINHDYGDKKVCLSVFLVDQFVNEPTNQEGQQGRWFTLDEMQKLAFPKANDRILSKLASLAQ